MREYDRGDDRQQAPEPTPAAPGPGTTAGPPGVAPVPESSAGARATGSDGEPEHPGPAPGRPPAPARRRAIPPLGSALDRNVWVWMLVIGAIVLVVLILLAVTALPSGHTKGSVPGPVGHPSPAAASAPDGAAPVGGTVGSVLA